MNILIITPFYKIEGRPELVQDTSAVHYLVRPWAQEHNVKVVYIYKNSFKKMLRYLKKRDRKYYKEGYQYVTDGVDVFLIEVQRIYHQGVTIDEKQGFRVKKMISEYLHSVDFEPEIVITHIPTETDGILDGMFSDKKRVAVLHSTDVLFSQKSTLRYELLEDNHDMYYSRAASIRRYFEKKQLKGLRQELIYSGVPSIVNTEKRIKKPTTFKFIYAGKLYKRKHVDITIKALAKLSNNIDYTFDIYGTGEDEEDLRTLSKKLLGTKCNFHGQVPRDYILKAMATSDIFIMPSTRETLGLVYIEAMSQGCIPIGVKGEGIDGTIVDSVNGFLVEPNNIQDLANKIKYICDLDEDTYMKIVNNAIQNGKYFNDEDMARRYLNLMLQCLDNPVENNNS